MAAESGALDAPSWEDPAQQAQTGRVLRALRWALHAAVKALLSFGVVRLLQEEVSWRHWLGLTTGRVLRAARRHRGGLRHQPRVGEGIVHLRGDG